MSLLLLLGAGAGPAADVEPLGGEVLAGHNLIGELLTGHNLIGRVLSALGILWRWL